ncbi:M20 metallopeptidase family protein [Sanyastnella coralliicola]|uniref:M20 metallopeptidase family protein n=1 Tax=Sanyastnella coralliicola TaxID=3069118 RepID=UPI0027B9737A|nr:M20 family metallopeptidase [Longitalea sp. SCSIO 12813]
MESKRIKDIAARIAPELIEIRQHLHQHPELSFKEEQTSAFVKSKLADRGIAFDDGYAGTGIVAKVKGKAGGKQFALRGDMDALPIQEVNDVAYRSTNPGVMHACGHDVHTSCALGAAFILHELRDEWAGEAHIVFQPGEEVLPGGASLMIKEGALSNELQGIVGQHVFPELEAGKVGFRSGMYMASCDELYFTVKGKGGHGALPHKNNDPVYATAQMVVALQQIASRNAPPEVPTVLSIGRIIAEGATNVIPNEVQVAGTFRTLDEEWRSKAHGLIEQVAKSTCAANGVEVEVDIRKGYPFLINQPDLTARAKKAAEDYLGSENVIDLDLRMTAEDFAYYSQHMAGCFYRLGTASANGENRSAVHTPTFNIDESAIAVGTGLMAWIALTELS